MDLESEINFKQHLNITYVYVFSLTGGHMPSTNFIVAI